MTFGLGSFLGPVIGGIMKDASDFRKTSDRTGFSCVGVFVFFTVASLIIQLDKPKLKENESRRNEEEVPLLPD
jgi:hypothetical protein